MNNSTLAWSLVALVILAIGIVLVWGSDPTTSGENIEANGAVEEQSGL